MARRNVPSTARNKKKAIARKKIDPRTLIERVTWLVSHGMSDPEVAWMLRIGIHTMYEYKRICPDFARAFKIGEKTKAKNVEGKLYQRAMGYSHPAVKIMKAGGRIVQVPYEEFLPPDVEAQKAFLKGNMPHKYREKVEHGGDPSNPVRFIIEGVTPVIESENRSEPRRIEQREVTDAELIEPDVR